MTAIQITHAEAATRIKTFAHEGRLVVGQWHNIDKQGREVACLLGAIHLGINSVDACPADLMPRWMAELTVVLFDKAGRVANAEISKRYAAALRVWGGLSKADWAAIKKRHLIRCIETALARAAPVASGHTVWPQVDAACRQMVAALGAGDAVSIGVARSAARSAAKYAAKYAAKSEARSAVWSGALFAAKFAAESAGAAKSAAESAAAALFAARSAARSAAGSAAGSAAMSAVARELFLALLEDIVATVATQRSVLEERVV